MLRIESMIAGEAARPTTLITISLREAPIVWAASISSFASGLGIVENESDKKEDDAEHEQGDLLAVSRAEPNQKKRDEGCRRQVARARRSPDSPMRERARSTPSAHPAEPQ